MDWSWCPHPAPGSDRRPLTGGPGGPPVASPERSLAGGTRLVGVSLEWDPGASTRSTGPPKTCCALRDVHLLRGAEREHFAHALPSVYARPAPAKQRHLFARVNYLPGSSKRAWNRSSIRVRQDSAEGESAPGPAAAGCPLPARPETYNPAPTPIATNPRTLRTIPTAGRLNAVTAPPISATKPTHDDHRGNDASLTADDPGVQNRRQSGVVAVQGALYFIELALLILGERHLVFPSRGNRPFTMC